MAMLSLLSVPCIILVSELTYRYVERPGIMMGRRIAIALQRRNLTVRLGSKAALGPSRVVPLDAG